MKTLATGFLLLASHYASFGQSAAAGEQALLTLENQRLEAVVTRNHDFLNNLYDNDFHGVLATGQSVGKVKMIEFLETSSPHVVQSIEDVKAKIYGMVALVTGKYVSKSKSGSIIGQSRFTHFYLKKAEQWKMIESQGTIVIQE